VGSRLTPGVEPERTLGVKLDRDVWDIAKNMKVQIENNLEDRKGDGCRIQVDCKSRLRIASKINSDDSDYVLSIPLGNSLSSALRWLFDCA
jgi:hypothetical protein